MNFRWSQRLVVALGILTALLGSGSTGCMGERPPVVRLQPNYLDKMQLIPVQYTALTQRGATPETLTAEDIRREPVWIHQVTIIDKPATTGFTGISWYTDMERINWEVTENFLIARQAYDRLHNGQGVDPRNPSRPGDNINPISNNPRQGEILAVYAIISHFDIRRSYNPGTGEEQNVIEENTTDRPWYQRRYIRVDWSRNLVSGYSAMSFAEWTGKVRAEPVPIQINDPSDPNRPVFHYEREWNGQQNVLTYFDVTARVILHPEEVNLAEYGFPHLPACLLIARATESCQPADVLMRQAFMRLDPNRDYEPQALDGHRMERFGFFESGRVGFNDHYRDILNTDRRHFSARHNIWMQHHARPYDQVEDQPRDPNTLHHLPNDIACRQDSDCERVSPTARCDTAVGRCGDRYIRCMRDEDCSKVGYGSRCDTNIAYLRPDNMGLCLLPYRRREVRPMGYHLSENYPARMMPVTRQVAREWNQAFARAVQSARHRECILDPAVTDKSTCEAWRDPVNPRRAERPDPANPGRFITSEQDDPAHVWVACHNPVWGTDPNLPGGPNPNNDGITLPRTVQDVEEARRNGWDLPSACGPQGTVARLGDIRYSMIASVNELDRNGPWGLAMISGDPVTGEVYSGRGAVWQTVTDLQAAWATDVIRLLNGDLTPEQVANGENVVEAYRAAFGLGERTARGGSETVPAATGDNLPWAPLPVHRDLSSRTEMENILNATTFEHLNVTRRTEPRASGFDPSWLPGGRLNINDLARGPDGRLTERAFLSNMASLLRDQLGLLSPSGRSGTGVRLARLRGTDIENRLMDAHMQAAFGPRAADIPLTREMLDQISPMRNNNNAFRALQNRLRALHSARQCNYEADFSDEVVFTLLHHFRNNRVPGGVDFGMQWNFVREDGRLDYDQIQRYLEQYIHYGVLAHELGHSIGQRHNFAASADAVNYHDRYWQLRSLRHDGQISRIRPRFEYLTDGDGMGRPDSRQYYSRVELEGGIEEYAYSSVMDYKGFNEDAHGLGRYDYAFVKHGYVDMVEAFERVANRADALHMFQGISGGGQQPVAFGLTGDGRNIRLTSFHYTDLPRIVGTTMVQTPEGRMVEVPNVGDSNRFDVFLHETISVPYNNFMWMPDHTNVAIHGRDGRDGDYLVVPYRFATDDYAGYYWYDQRYDAGADMYESLRYTSQRYLDYYFANSFSRERSTFSVDGYISRMRGRFLDNLYYVMRVASIYHMFFNNIFANVTNYNEWLNQTSGRAQRLGIATSMDTFVNAIVMPEWSIYGSAYTLRTRPDGTQIYEEANFGDPIAFQLEIGEGRMFMTRYDWGSGYFWRDRLINAGSYYDKLMALDYLTDTFLFAPERGLDQDLRNRQVNVYTVYPAQTIRFFGSILSEDDADIGVLIRNPSGQHQILRTQLALLNLPPGTGPNQNGRDPALRAIDTNLGFTGRLWSAVFSMANLSQGFDQRFMHYARLWVDGDPNEVRTDPSTPAEERLQTVSFVDPFTRLTYRAIHFGREPGDPRLDPGASARELARVGGNVNDAERGIGARMILHANDLKRAWQNATNPTERNRLEYELRRYVDLLNIVRRLNQYFGIGNQVVGPSLESSGE